MSRIADGATWWRHPGWPNPAWVYDNVDHLCATPYKLGEMMAPSTPPMELRSPSVASPSVNWNNGGLAGMGFIATTPSGQVMNGTAPMPSFFGGSIAPNPLTGSVPSAAGTAPPVMGIPSATNPVFYDNSGMVITSAICGSIYNMTVPGYEGQQLVITQTKNGTPSFSGPMQIPMLNYPSKCNQDEGTYDVQAFTLAGALLGGTTFTVLPAVSLPSAIPAAGPLTPSPTAAPAPGTTSATSPLPAGSSTVPPAAPAIGTTGVLSGLSTTDWLVIAVLAVVVVAEVSKRR